MDSLKMIKSALPKKCKHVLEGNEQGWGSALEKLNLMKELLNILDRGHLYFPPTTLAKLTGNRCFRAKVIPRTRPKANFHGTMGNEVNVDRPTFGMRSDHRNPAILKSRFNPRSASFP